MNFLYKIHDQPYLFMLYSELFIVYVFLERRESDIA